MGDLFSLTEISDRAFSKRLRILIVRKDLKDIRDNVYAKWFNPDASLGSCEAIQFSASDINSQFYILKEIELSGAV